MHSWNLKVNEAIQLQRELSHFVSCTGKPEKINLVAGIDIAYDPARNKGFCAIAIFRYPEPVLVKVYYDTIPVKFPYVPGLLSFREGPLILKTYKKIKIKPDLLIFDGHGIAHPRRFGIAAHMGLLLNTPAIGCAKSILNGTYSEPEKQKHAKHYIYDLKGEKTGIVLRTRTAIKPVFISPGYRIGIDESAEIIMNCVTRYRIPEPVRVADIKVAEFKRSESGK
ncbi:MAG: endonuclease V [Bacteroidales bacterium]|nr:MAG: endonuclease V [Bacteroidales bacterium]